MKKLNTKEFDTAYKRFLTEKDPDVHRKAVETLLASVELEESYKEFLNETDGVKKFFFMWGRAGRKEEDPQERAALQEMGAMSKRLYEQKDYRGLSEMFFNIAFRHLANFIRLEERKDFEEITDHDLYEKQLIPSGIFLQFFLIETLVKRSNFDWDRGEEIANQNLACLIICFGDMYEFFHEETE